MNDDVLIGVDPHKASNTLAVMDPVSRSVIEASRFENTSEGYKDLKTFVRRWSKRRFAVEGCHGAGRSLSQRLVADGEVVLDVPPKLAARVLVSPKDTAERQTVMTLFSHRTGCARRCWCPACAAR